MKLTKALNVLATVLFFVLLFMVVGVLIPHALNYACTSSGGKIAFFAGHPWCVSK